MSSFDRLGGERDLDDAVVRANRADRDPLLGPSAKRFAQPAIESPQEGYALDGNDADLGGVVASRRIDGDGERRCRSALVEQGEAPSGPEPTGIAQGATI